MKEPEERSVKILRFIIGKKIKNEATIDGHRRSPHGTSDVYQPEQGEQAEPICILDVPIEIDSACNPTHVVLKDFYYLLSHLYVELHPVLPIAFLHNM